MKLHLPIGLRKALLAVFAVVTPATVAVTAANATAMADTIDPVVLQWIADYNSNAAANGGNLIYLDGTTPENIGNNFQTWTETYTGAVTVPLGAVEGLEAKLKEKSSVLGWLYGQIGDALLTKSSYSASKYGQSGSVSVKQDTISDKQLSGVLSSNVVTSGTEIETNTDTPVTKYLNEVLGTSGQLDGSSYHISASSDTKDILANLTYTEAAIDGKVNVDWSYSYNLGFTSDSDSDTFTDMAFSVETDDFTREATIATGVDKVIVNYGAVDYVLEGGQNVTRDGSITMKGEEVANTFTMGSATGENTSATLIASGDINLAASDFFKAQGGSGLMAVNVNINAAGEISFVAGSGVSAGESINLTGGTVLLDGAQLSSSVGSAFAPDLDDEEEVSVVDATTADFVINGTEGIQIIGGTQLAGANVAVNSTEGAITVGGGSSVVATQGTVNMEAAKELVVKEDSTIQGEQGVQLVGDSIAIDGTVLGGKGFVSMEADNGVTITSSSLLQTTVSGSKPRPITIDGGTHVSLSEGADIRGYGVELTGDAITADGDGTLIVGGGYVKLSGGSSVTLSNEAQVQGTQVDISAEVITMNGKNAQISSGGNGQVTMTATDYIELNDAIINGKVDNGVSLKGTNAVNIVGTTNIMVNGSIDLTSKAVVVDASTLTSNLGNVLLQGSSSNAIQNGSKVTATEGNVKLSSTGITAANTITGSTITAGGEFSMVGDEANLIIYKHPTSGTNTITDSTIQAGSTVNLHGLQNTIKGTVTDGVSSTLVSGSGVNVGMAKGTLYNDISGASVTATTGNIVMNAIANNVGTGSVLTSEQGSIALKGATIESLSAILNVLGSLDIDLPIDSLDISANMVAGTLNAGQNVSMDATANILSGGAVNGGTGVALSGALNVLTGSNVASSTGGVDLLANQGVGGTLIDTLLDLAKDNGIDLGDLSQWTDALKGLTTEQGINVLTGGSVSGNTYVNMDGIANVMTNGTVGSNGAVTLDGAINAVTGGSLTGGSVAMLAAKDKSLDLSGIISAVLGTTQGDETTTPDGGDGSEPTDSTLSDLLTQLGTINGNGNVVFGENTVVEATTGDVTMDGTINVLGGGKVDANQNVLLNGEINVLAGTNVIADNGDINLTASSENGALAGALVGLLDEEMQEQLKPLLDSFDGGVNVMAGGSMNAVAGNVNLQGMANVLTAGTVTAGEAVTLDGAINAVAGGSIEGDSIVFKNSGTGLPLGDVVSSLIGGEVTDNTISDIIDSLSDSDLMIGGANLVIGGETTTLTATTGDVTMDGALNLVTGGKVSADMGGVIMNGTANVLTGGDVNANQAVAMNGTINAVIDGEIEGGSVAFGADANGGIPLGDLLSSLMGENVDSTITDLVSELDLNGNANLVTGGSVNATTAGVNMTGTLNLLTGGDVSADKGGVAVNGTLNLLTGGDVSTTTGDVTVNGALNLVTGTDFDAAGKLTLDGPANIVTGGTLSGGSVELKGDDMPLGSLVGGLLDGVLEGVELPEELNGLVSGSVTDVLNNLTGNFNVVTGSNTLIDADTTTTLTGTANYVGDGATVAGTNVTLKGAANVVLNGATLEADDALTLTGTGAGLSLGSFITIPEEYKEYADQLGLTALLNKEASANVVMGNETSLVGKTVELSAMVNMLSDRAMVTGGEVALNGNLNIVTDGVNIETTSEDISLVGDLNLVTHIVLDDLMNAIQNGTALPTDNGEYTTLLESAGDINLIGAANAVHGDVVLNAKGDVLMEGSGQPLFNTDSLNLQQVVDLAAKLGAGELLGTAKDEALALIKDYINTNDLSGLVDIAKELGVEDMLSGSLEDGKQSLLAFIQQNAEAKLPQLDLTGNVNTVSGGASVHGANVIMNGTANLVTDGSSITAEGAVNMNGMANVVAGGATVSGTDVNLSGGMNVIVDTTLDNVKDAITNGSLDSIATGGTTQTTIAAKDELVLDATANLVNGYVSLSSDNSVTMEGITNVVAGEAEVQGANSVEMDGVLNVVAGGATVGSSAGDITMGGGMNMIVDTSLENVVDALQQQSLAPLMQGGSVDTTLTAASDITLNATVNAVNGGQVTLDAGDTMKMSGAVNVVSGNATLKGEDIVMAGDKSLAVDLNTLLPAEWADKAAELGLSDMLEGGLSLNAVAGGANLIAEDDITMSGIASVVVDTTMTNIMDALATQSIEPLIKGGTSETNLEANNINMLSKLNVVSGGKVRLDADNNVKMDGVANMVHGNTVVEAANTISVSGAANVVAGGATLDAKNIKMTGKGSISADLEGLLPADWAEKAAELGLTDVLEKGVNVNAVAGGANLLADEDITMGGMASFVVDTTVENVVDALKQMSIDPLLQGGTTETVLSAEREIHMNSLVNVVSGGKVTVEAGRNVNMSGVANVVNGNAVVDAGETIYMFGAANVVSGGADLTADYIEMTGNGSINGKIAGVLESVLPDVDLPTNGSVNAILGEGTTLDADKVALSGALNVVDGAKVSGDDSVLMNGNVNMLSNNAQVVSENGNISINGGAGMQSVTTMENASLTAEKGKVVFNNALVGSTDSTVTAGLGMTVKGNSSVQLNDVLLGGETLVSADSDLEIDGMLQTNDGTFIENMGSLSLNDVALSAGSELFNGGVIQIDGDLSLDSAKLTFVIESLTNNDTAITLGANANITAADITNVTFVIESDKVASALYNYEEFSFVLFENASAEDFSLVEAALAQDEITFTINGATWSDFNDELEVRHEGGNIVIMGNVVIPEPTTATLSLLALAALAARRRRK